MDKEWIKKQSETENIEQWKENRSGDVRSSEMTIPGRFFDERVFAIWGNLLYNMYNF